MMERNLAMSKNKHNPSLTISNDNDKKMTYKCRRMNSKSYIRKDDVPAEYVKETPSSILKRNQMDKRISSSFNIKSNTPTTRITSKPSNKNSLRLRNDYSTKGMDVSSNLPPQSKSSSAMVKSPHSLVNNDSDIASFTSFNTETDEKYQNAINYLLKSSISETEGGDNLDELLSEYASVLDDKSNENLVEKVPDEERNDCEIFGHFDITPPSNNLHRHVKQFETREIFQSSKPLKRQAVPSSLLTEKLSNSQQQLSSPRSKQSKMEDTKMLSTQRTPSLYNEKSKNQHQQHPKKLHRHSQEEVIISKEVKNKVKTKTVRQPQPELQLKKKLKPELLQPKRETSSPQSKGKETRDHSDSSNQREIEGHKKQTQPLSKKKLHNPNELVKKRGNTIIHQTSSTLQADENVKLRLKGSLHKTKLSQIQKLKTPAPINGEKKERSTVENSSNEVTLSKPKKEQKRKQFMKPAMSCITVSDNAVVDTAIPLPTCRKSENVGNRVSPTSCLRTSKQKESSLTLDEKRKQNKFPGENPKLKRKASSISFRPIERLDNLNEKNKQTEEEMPSNIQGDNKLKKSSAKCCVPRNELQSHVKYKLNSCKGILKSSINQKKPTNKPVKQVKKKITIPSTATVTHDNDDELPTDNDESISKELNIYDASSNNGSSVNNSSFLSMNLKNDCSVLSSLSSCRDYSRSNLKDFEDSMKIKTVNNILNCASPVTVENEDVQENKPHVMDAFRNPYLYNKIVNDDYVSSSEKVKKMDQAVTPNELTHYTTTDGTAITTASNTKTSPKKLVGNNQSTNEDYFVGQRKNFENGSILTELMDQDCCHPLTSSSINDNSTYPFQKEDKSSATAVHEIPSKAKVAVQNHVLDAVLGNSSPDQSVPTNNKQQLQMNCHHKENCDHRKKRTLFENNGIKDVNETGHNKLSEKNVSFGTDHQTTYFCSESFALSKRSDSLKSNNDEDMAKVRRQSHRPQQSKSQSIIERSLCGLENHTNPGKTKESVQHEEYAYNSKSEKDLRKKTRKSSKTAIPYLGGSMRRSFSKIKKKNQKNDNYEEEAGLKNVAVSYNEIGEAKNVLSLIGYTHKPPVEDKFGVIIKVEASTVSRIDCEMRRNVFLKSTPLPFSPGIDCVGTVHRVGAQAYRQYDIAEGDRVATLSPYLGANSRYVSVHAKDIIKVPKRLDSIEVSCIMSSYIVAYQCLYRIGNFELKKGDRVLVTGANGSVGRAVIELALLGGARDVYAVAHIRHQKLLESMGAIHVHSSRKDGFSLFHEIEGTMDIVIDTIGGNILRTCCDTLDSKRGRLISVGMLSNVSSSGMFGMPLSVFVDKAVVQWKTKLMFSEQVLKYDLFKAWKTKKNEMKEDLRYLFHLLSRRDIQPLITRVVSLQGVADAHDEIENGRSVGYIVCTPWKKLKKNDQRMRSQRVEYKKAEISKQIERAFSQSGLSNQLCRVSL